MKMAEMPPMVKKIKFYRHSDKQFGFVEGKSTLDAIKEVIWDVRGLSAAEAAAAEIRDAAEKKYRAAAFLDMKGAFDSVWWPGPR